MKRILLIALVLLLTVPAVAAAGRPPLGLRAGYTKWDDLNQIHVGGHAKLGDLFPNIAFTPSLEVGFGDGATVVTVNGDIYYRATELIAKPWGLYGGGSLSFNWVDVDAGSNTDLGLSLLLGTTYELSNSNELMAELRFGILDSPDFKLTFGYTFF